MFSLGSLSTNLKRVKVTYFKIKYPILKKKRERDDPEITSHILFKNFFR